MELSGIDINPLTPNDPYRRRTPSLTSKRCILCISSTNIGTEYFEHGIYSPCFSLQNAVCFIILTYLVPVLFTFYIQCAKIKKKIIPAPKVTPKIRGFVLTVLTAVFCLHAQRIIRKMRL